MQPQAGAWRIERHSVNTCGSCAEHRHSSNIRLDHIRRLLSVFGRAVLGAMLHERQRSLCTGTLKCAGGNIGTDTCLECVRGEQVLQ